MKASDVALPIMVPVDAGHARMMAYARSAEGEARIAKAQAEIDAGLGIVATDSYFEGLRERRAQRRTDRS